MFSIFIACALAFPVIHIVHIALLINNISITLGWNDAMVFPFPFFTAELEQAEALKYLYRWLQNHPKYGSLAPVQQADSLYYADVSAKDNCLCPFFLFCQVSIKPIFSCILS